MDETEQHPLRNQLRLPGDYAIEQRTIRLRGLRRLRIQPEVVGDLSSVEASWETFRGPVGVSWRVEGDRFNLDLELPPGVTATVVLPASSPDQVREGRAAAPAR